MDCSPPGFSVHRNSPGQNTGVGSLSLLQGIFPTQGLNPGLPRYRQIIYHLSHQGSPRTLQWVAYPFSGGSSQSRNQTGVSSIADEFFTSWATREAPTSRVMWHYLEKTDCSLPGSPVHEILQARILEWVVFPSTGDLSNPGIKPGSPALQADSLQMPGKFLRERSSGI